MARLSGNGPRGPDRRRFLSCLGWAALGLAAPWPALAQVAQGLATQGHELLNQGKAAEAVATLTEASRLDPTNAWVWNLLGRAYRLQGDQRRALESFQAALRADPADGYARMMQEIISQRPLPPASQSQQKPGRSRRSSPQEEEARKERETFLGQAAPAGKSRLIVLDAGHGGADNGVAAASGLLEKEVTLDMARRLARLLVDRGWRVLLTRDADYGVPLWARGAMAQAFGADVFVSLHATAAQASGLEVFAFAGEASSPQAREVVELENGVVRFERLKPPRPGAPGAHQFLTGWQAGRLTERGRAEAGRVAAACAVPKPMAGARLGLGPLAVLEGAVAVGLLVQMGYLSNPADALALANQDFRQNLALALTQALTG